MRKILLFCLTLMIVLSTIACGNDNQEELVPVTLRATIIEMTDRTFMVEPVEGSQELKSANRIVISRDKIVSSETPKVGDTLEIIYSGEILETYPAQLSQIQGITIVEVASDTLSGEKDEYDDMELPMLIMVDGILYYTMGDVYDKTKITCGTLDGQIESKRIVSGCIPKF